VHHPDNSLVGSGQMTKPLPTKLVTGDVCVQAQVSSTNQTLNRGLTFLFLG